jgi:hypothetical protein
MGAGGGYQPPAATPYPNAQPYGTPPGPQMAMGTPGGMPAGGLAQQHHQQQQGDSEGPQRTVLGVQAPAGLPNYANYRPSQQQAAVNPNAQSYPGYQQPQQTPPGGYGGYQQGYPQQGQQGQYGMPQGMYGSGQMGAMSHSTPIDQMGGMGGATPMPNEGKKSTLVRDIAIGVGIAALVLVGFLVVKMFVLDKDTAATAGSAAPVSKLANVKIKMPDGAIAEMEVDGARVATVENGREIALSPGKKSIKLTGKDGLSCEDKNVELEAGKTALLVCGFPPKDAGSASTNAGSAAGSATTQTNTGSAAQVAQGTPETKTDTKSDTKDVTVSKTDTKTDTKSDTKTGTSTKTDTKTGTGTTAVKTDTKTDTKTGTGTTTTKTDTKTGTGTTTTKTDTKTGTGTTATKTDTKTGTDKGDATKGYLQVFSKPNAKILVDGVDTNLKTPISGHQLPLTAGKHKITFVIGDDRFTYPVVIKAGQTEQMSKDLQ